MHTFLVKRLDPHLLIYTSFVVSACDSRPCKNNGTCHVNFESGLATFNKKCVHHKIRPSISIIKRYNGNDPQKNRVLPLLEGNHVAKFVKDPIYRNKVIVRKL
jgi:hypothetical protein